MAITDLSVAPSRDSASTWRVILPPFITTKVLALSVAFLYVWGTSTAVGFPSWNDVRGAWLHWDAEHYAYLAQNGYPSHFDFRDAFFPGYPLLIRLALPIFSDVVVAGLVVSAIAGLVALYAIARLINEERDGTDATFAVWLVAAWPFALFFSAIYTESTFIAAAALCLLYARRGCTVQAAVTAAAACAIRVNGVALIVAMVVEYIRHNRWRPRWDALILLIIPLPIIGEALYMKWRTGDALAFVHAERLDVFGGLNIASPWTGFWTTWHTVFSSAPAGTTYIFAVELFCGVAGGIVCILAWLHGRFPRSFATYCTIIWLMATSLTFWRSVPRYELAMFPAILLLVDALRARGAWRIAMVSLSTGFMAFGCAIYASGRWLG